MKIEICLYCSRLGNCEIASVEMLRKDEGCGSWFAAHPREVKARKTAIALTGTRALEALIAKGPPNKPAKDYRR